jgi:crotonobetainyl-CoA:carnitine CoA-transferase CaiB-like acyl-CoA transferase
MQPQRSAINNGHPLLSAPYGIYKTANGFIALAMIDIPILSKAIHCQALEVFSQNDAFSKRDIIKNILQEFLITQESKHWISLLQNEGLWAMEVLDWNQMKKHEAYKVLEMEQVVYAQDEKIYTTRCPISINGEKLYAAKPAPQLGEHNEHIIKEFLSEAE